MAADFLSDPPSEQHPTSQLLVRYLAGRASENEAAELRSAVPHVDYIREALEHGPVVDAVPVWEGVRTRLARGERLRATRPSRWISAGVAIGALSGAVSLAAVMLSLDGSQTRTSDAANRRYATRAGETMHLSLPDGSRMQLAPSSTIAISEKFGASNRVMTLEGEALFTVRSASGAPFVVRAGGMTTRVLGTTFSVRRYAGDRLARVVVTAGKVVVSADSVSDETLVVKAGDVADVSDSSARIIAAGDIEQSTDWQSGQLVFRNTPIADVFATLGRWYGYRIRATDSAMTTERVTVGVSTRSSADALSTLARLLNADVNVNGDVVTLRARFGTQKVAPVRRSTRQMISTPNLEAGR
jgi:transmembrane sensor